MKTSPPSMLARARWKSRCAALIVSCLSVSFLAAQPNPGFVLEFNAPAQVTGSPGQVVQFEASVRLTAANQEVQGWSLAVTPLNVAEAVILSVTTQGTVAADSNDDPPGLRTTGFEKTELSVIPPGGAVSAVVLSFTMPIALEPAGLPYDILRFTVQTIVPPDGSEAICTLGFVDGLQGTGQPVSNRLTVQGSTLEPTVLARDVLVSSGTGNTSLLGTEFTYQGSLREKEVPLNGFADFQFTLWRHPTLTNDHLRVGQTQTIDDLLVQYGLFQVRLNDEEQFGAAPFGVLQNWLEIAVRVPSGSGPFTTLTPRQPLTATPQSGFALKASWNGLTGIPPGFADGIDDTGSGQWNEITGIPPGFADGIDDVGVDEWDELSGIPAGFADKLDNDLLALLNCMEKNSVPSFDGSAWGCRVLPSTLADGNSLDASDGSPVNAVFVDSIGQVGVGTTTPSQLLHVQDGAAGLLPNANSTLVVERKDSTFINVLTPDGVQSGVLFGNPTGGSAAGGLIYNNSANAHGFQFRVDGNKTKMVLTSGGILGVGTSGPSSSKSLTLQGVGANSGWLQFRDSSGKDRWHLTEEGGGLNIVESGVAANRLFLEPGGNVGIGTASPDAKLAVNGKASNSTGVWSVFSDRRLKENVEKLEPGSLDRLLRLQGVTYDYAKAEQREGYEGKHRGWIAQEVEEVFPEWVSESQDGMKMVTPVGFNALTVEALRELRAEKDAEIAELKSTVEQLRQLLLQLTKDPAL